jgi:hypothetical protein
MNAQIRRFILLLLLSGSNFLRVISPHSYLILQLYCPRLFHCKRKRIGCGSCQSQVETLQQEATDRAQEATDLFHFGA